MILPGHLSAGFLTTYGLLAATSLGSALTHGQMDTLLVAGTLLGDGPDIDVLYSFFAKKSLNPAHLSGHRTYLTHAPLLWLIAGLIIFSASWAFSVGPFWEVLGLLVWLCPWSHFICDSVDSGIMWLWPLSRRQFAIHNPQEELTARNEGIHARWSDLFVSYFKNPLAYLEVALTLVAIYVAVTRL